MPELEQLLKLVFNDNDLLPEDIPKLDLYMDQVLSLFDQGLSSTKRDPSDKLLTKTMVHNYVKEGLMQPVRGKKYTRQQVMQLLCVYRLKQTLRLNDVKALTGRADVDFEACYTHLLSDKKRIRSTLPPMLSEQLPADLTDPNERLSLCLALSEIAVYLRRLCECLIDSIHIEGDEKNVY